MGSRAGIYRVDWLCLPVVVVVLRRTIAIIAVTIGTRNGPNPIVRYRRP